MTNDVISKVKSLEGEKKEWIYEHSEDKKCRYLLGEKGKKMLVCCGVNPSNASPEKLDQTMKRVVSIANGKGYDGYVMINLYHTNACSL